MSRSFDFDLKHQPIFTAGRELGIGVIGSGFIVRDVQLPAYREAGYRVVGIASRNRDHAQAAATANGMVRVYDDWRQLLSDPDVQIVDLAYPPDCQAEVISEVVRHADHIKGILAQKPLAMSLTEAENIVRQCEQAGVVLSVNQNMRYDQSIRALKTLLERGDLGAPVVAQIIMNVKFDWQSFVANYDRIMLLNMSIHHLDAYRYLFGDPQRIVVSVTRDQHQRFSHIDGSAFWCLEYADGLRALAVENAAAEHDFGITWRVDGTAGMASGTIGWPDFPRGKPSTIAFRTFHQPGLVFRPEWKEQWFPQAFAGTMGQLLDAVANGTEPALSGKDNLRSMALVEAAYRSAVERRAVEIAEVLVAGPVA